MLLPAGAAPEARLLLIGRALRAFTDGFVAILLPVYLLTLGLGKWEVGLISSATLLGSALATLAVGQWGHRFRQRSLLLAAAGLMTATGLLLAGLGGIGAFWPLAVVAFVGTMNRQQEGKRARRGDQFTHQPRRFITVKQLICDLQMRLT